MQRNTSILHHVLDMKLIKKYWILLLAAVAALFAGCAKMTVDGEDYTIDIELLFNVKNLKGNNILAPENMGSLTLDDITATYKQNDYKLDGPRDKEGTGLTLVKDRNGVPVQIGFGPVPGAVIVVEEPLYINIGGQSFKILITNKNDLYNKNTSVLRREVLFMGKDYYSGRTIIDLIVSPDRQLLYPR